MIDKKQIKALLAIYDSAICKYIIFIVSGILLQSCHNGDVDGFMVSAKSRVQFGFGTDNSQNGRNLELDEPYELRLSIETEEGDLEEDQIRLELFSFGASYTSEALELQEGSYKLTLFQVLNSEGEIIYAAPMEGSLKANLVLEPLPISFDVFAEETSLIRPEVVTIMSEDNPSDFGYTSFEFDVVDNFFLSMQVVSDLDSSLVGGDWQFVGYAADSTEVSEKIVSYDPASSDDFVLDGSQAFYKISSVNQSDYHTITHYFRTDFLREKETLAFSLAPVDLNEVVRLEHELFGLNTFSFYYPIDMCKDNFRVDLTGIASEIEMNEMWSTVYLEHIITDKTGSWVSCPFMHPIVIEEYGSSNLIFRPRNSFYGGATFCESLYDECPEETFGFGIETFIAFLIDADYKLIMADFALLTRNETTSYEWNIKLYDHDWEVVE